MKAESVKQIHSWIVEPARNWSCNANNFLPTVVLRLLYQQAVITAHRTGLEVFLSQPRDVAESQAALHGTKSNKPQPSSWDLNGNTTRLGFWRSLRWEQEHCAGGFGVGYVGHGVPWMWGVWLSPSGAAPSCCWEASWALWQCHQGWSPAQLVIGDIPPADREVFLHLRISPLNVSAAVAVDSVGA